MDEIDVVFTMDTTGSMYPCLAEVRRRVSETVKRLFDDIPGIRIGIIAHGDYIDRRTSYVTHCMDLTNNKDALVDFVKGVGRTDGGDLPECYELALRRAREMHWRDGAKKAVVVVGDAEPHPVHYALNTLAIDWKDEVRTMGLGGTTIYAVRCLERSYPQFTKFWELLGEMTPGGATIRLHQFPDIVELIHAICYKQAGNEYLEQYEQELISNMRLNRGIANFIDTLLGRETSTATVMFGSADLESVPPGRFQVLNIDKQMPIKDFVLSTGAEFRKGRGFYEFTKTETIQERKEVVLMDKKSGDMFTGRKAREMIGVPYGTRARLKPADLEKYRIFVQSTSYNRILMPSTMFLYEVMV